MFDYATPLIKAVNKNDGKVTDEMLIDMTDYDAQTQATSDYFAAQIKKRSEGQENPDWYKVVRNSMIATFWPTFMKNVVTNVAAEGITIGYIYLLTFLIRWLQDPEASVSQGIWLCAIYVVMIFVSVFIRNQYIMNGYQMAIMVRKAVI
jgi:hypothetical protein